MASKELVSLVDSTLSTEVERKLKLDLNQTSNIYESTELLFRGLLEDVKKLRQGIFNHHRKMKKEIKDKEKFKEYLKKSDDFLHKYLHTKVLDPINEIYFDKTQQLLKKRTFLTVIYDHCILKKY